MVCQGFEGFLSSKDALRKRARNFKTEDRAFSNYSANPLEPYLLRGDLVGVATLRLKCGFKTEKFDRAPQRQRRRHRHPDLYMGWEIHALISHDRVGPGRQLRVRHGAGMVHPHNPLPVHHHQRRRTACPVISKILFTDWRRHSTERGVMFLANGVDVPGLLFPVYLRSSGCVAMRNAKSCSASTANSRS